MNDALISKARAFAVLAALCLFSSAAFAKGPLSAPKNAADVVVLQSSDPLPAQVVELTTVEIGGDNTDNATTYPELVATAKLMAQKVDANIVKITKCRHASNKDRDRLTATFYKTDNPRLFEKEFEWQQSRKLTWADFKGNVPQNANEYTAAATYCGIGFETNVVTSNTAPKISVYNTFYTSQSWVRPEERTPEILAHEQGHFDICEIYTRILKDRMCRAAVTVYNMKRVLERIYSEVDAEYQAKQEEYEKQTQHGVDEVQQRKWIATLVAHLVNDGLTISVSGEQALP